ncbi:hypothetical protein E1301_Tti011676 [Triplophysa tibetana]|uniref:Uncharacterized protein n=1 Tax=Triplophysa tibetana TaxID=1572043 RepID=A0A5A9PGS8_9TELE|nr:hypothetical protein E1301_Tti011676 [Triplophysa tibetana]
MTSALVEGWRNEIREPQRSARVVLFDDMGKLQEFEITFTNSKVVYNPGESISGTVRVKTNHSLQFKAQRIDVWIVYLCALGNILFLMSCCWFRFDLTTKSSQGRYERYMLCGFQQQCGVRMCIDTCHLFPRVN